MKNALKTLGILLIVAAAFLIASCGPPVEPGGDTFTVTFDSDGGSPVNSQTIEKDGFATEPSPPPTKAAGAAPAKPSATTLYKLGTTAPTFAGWELEGETYAFSTPVTQNIILKAKWTEPTTGGTTTVSLTGNDDVVYQAITAINEGGNTDKYVLYLAADVDAATNKAWTMQKGELTIDSTNNLQRTIKSPVISGTGNLVYATVGQIGTTTVTNNSGRYVDNPKATPKLTLKNIILQGTGTAVGDSLVLVISGGTLILDTNTVVKGHKNSATSSDGANGNGSAVCLYGGNLTMKGGAIIEQNESTNNSVIGSGTATSRNRVGGVYTYVPTGGDVKLDIQGGIIENNVCTAGNTKDLYATEGGTFTLGGQVTIGELTINADGSPLAHATIIVSGLANNVGKLSLRSSVELATVKTRWAGTGTTAALQILSGPLDASGNKTVPAAADLEKFTLGDFKGSNGYEEIGSGYEIGADGKLKTK